MEVERLKVKNFLNKLDHPLKPEIELLRKIIFSANNQLSEHIKWNAPSFVLNGEDCLTFNFPPKKNCILLVFHRGAKIKEVPIAQLIEDRSGMLEWKSTDRAIARFYNSRDIENQKAELEKIIQNWLKALFP